jgi:hypothetical protein
MYSVDLVRCIPGLEWPEPIVSLSPDSATFSEAFEAGKRAYAIRGAEAQADGFRVVKRETSEKHYWFPDR